MPTTSRYAAANANDEENQEKEDYDQNHNYYDDAVSIALG